MSSTAPENLRWVHVAHVGEVSPGQVRGVEAAGRVVALLNRDGELFALDAVCPHRGGPLDEGVLWRGALECPWHRFRFDPATGANVYPANVYPDDLPQLQAELKPARTFPLEVRGEDVFVGLPGGLSD